MVVKGGTTVIFRPFSRTVFLLYGKVFIEVFIEVFYRKFFIEGFCRKFFIERFFIRKLFYKV